MNKEYYQYFQPNDVDTLRAEQFDAIHEDDEFPVELKAKMANWYNTLTNSVPKMGDKMAKSLVVSVLRWHISTNAEKQQAARLGRMHNSMAPKFLDVR